MILVLFASDRLLLLGLYGTLMQVWHAKFTLLKAFLEPHLQVWGQLCNWECLPYHPCSPQHLSMTVGKRCKFEVYIDLTSSAYIPPALPRRTISSLILLKVIDMVDAFLYRWILVWVYDINIYVCLWKPEKDMDVLIYPSLYFTPLR